MRLTKSSDVPLEMPPRQERILKTVVEAIMQQPEPISSQWLAEHFDFAVSSATLRNDLVALTEAGYLRQPHPSAGRLPTEKAYAYYLSRFSRPVPRVASSQRFRRVIRDHRRAPSEDLLYALAQTLAHMSGAMTIAAARSQRTACVGLSHLLAEPELRDWNFVQTISRLLDHLDGALENLYGLSDRNPRVLFGAQNPFGPQTSMLFLEFPLTVGAVSSGFLGLVGPLRMDYPKNLDLMETLSHVLEESF